MDWQDFIAAAIALAAVLFLAWQGFGVLRRRRAAGCASGCSSCPAGVKSGVEKVQPLIEVGGLQQSARQLGRDGAGAGETPRRTVRTGPIRERGP